MNDNSTPADNTTAPSQIFTFTAKTTIMGTVSIAADTIAQARDALAKLSEADTFSVVTEPSSCNTTFSHGFLNDSPDDGVGLARSPRDNAAENAQALSEIEEDEKDDLDTSPTTLV